MKLQKKKNKNCLFDYLAYLAIIIFVLFFIYLSIGRHNSLKSFQNDLGAYSQVTWNNLHGHFFESSGSFTKLTLKPDGTTLEDYNFLAGHFSPILLFFVPFYALWADPKIFLIIQAIAVGIGALPIYWLAREKIKIKWGGLVFLLSFLFYPVVHNALLYDFHEVTFAVPIVTFALWFLYKKNYKWLLVFLFLLLLVQEHTSLIVFMFGLYILFFQKQRKLGILISLISLIYFVITIFVLMPAFSPTDAPVILKSMVDTGNRYSWLGGDFSEIFKTIFTRPLFVFQGVFRDNQLSFLMALFFPLLFLPFFSGLILLTLPVFAINLLSQYRMTYSVYFYHSVIIAGILFFAAIFSFEKIIKAKIHQKFILVFLLIISVIYSYKYSVTPFSKTFSFNDFRPTLHAKLISEVKQIIPDDASLSIQHNLGPHFANRRKLFQFPYNVPMADYVVLDIYDPYQNNQMSFFRYGGALMGDQDATIESFKEWLKWVDELFDVVDFGVIYSNDGWLVFQRGATQELNAQAKEDFYKALERFIVK
jgi:uncharacterized membrane protein